jgi:hypothetical protein
MNGYSVRSSWEDLSLPSLWSKIELLLFDSEPFFGSLVLASKAYSLASAWIVNMPCVMWRGQFWHLVRRGGPPHCVVRPCWRLISFPWWCSSHSFSWIRQILKCSCMELVSLERLCKPYQPYQEAIRTCRYLLDMEIIRFLIPSENNKYQFWPFCFS